MFYYRISAKIPFYYYGKTAVKILYVFFLYSFGVLLKFCLKAREKVSKEEKPKEIAIGELYYLVQQFNKKRQPI